MSKIILTGASGFIGTHVLRYFSKEHQVIPCSFTNYKGEKNIVSGASVAIHLAGIAHRMEKTPDQLYFDVNTSKTLEFAKQAKQCGVRTFIFMSSVKVYGFDSSAQPIDHKTPCIPTDAYGRSKLEAEEGLRELEDNNFRVVCIRTPVVYGSGVKGNILKLIRLVDKLPILPFQGIDNSRSMIFVGNLVQYIDKSLNGNFSGVVLPSDPQLLSTSNIVRFIANELSGGKVQIKLPFLGHFLKILKPNLYDRLYGDLIVDSTNSNKQLGFEPAISSQRGFVEMLEWYKKI